MRKFLKSLIVTGVLLAVTASALFFCCVDKIAEASFLKNVAAEDCCDSVLVDHQKESKPCLCVIKGLTESQAKLSARALSLSHAFYHQRTVCVFNQTDFATALNTDYGSAPPKRYRSIALYLQYHSIRV